MPGTDDLSGAVSMKQNRHGEPRRGVAIQAVATLCGG
jgi:hypothetical protein